MTYPAGMRELLAVCLGGALGSGARHLVSIVVVRSCGAGFPWGTLAVNVLGSFVLAMVAYAAFRE